MFLWTSINTLEMQPVRPVGKIMHFKVQASHKEGNDKFYRFSSARAHGYFLIHKFETK